MSAPDRTAPAADFAFDSTAKGDRFTEPEPNAQVNAVMRGILNIFAPFTAAPRNDAAAQLE